VLIILKCVPRRGGSLRSNWKKVLKRSVDLI